MRIKFAQQNGVQSKGACKGNFLILLKSTKNKRRIQIPPSLTRHLLSGAHSALKHLGNSHQTILPQDIIYSTHRRVIIQSQGKKKSEKHGIKMTKTTTLTTCKPNNCVYYIRMAAKRKKIIHVIWITDFYPLFVHSSVHIMCVKRWC